VRLFALSDIHIDHPANRQWVDDLSLHDHRHDVLILAGDVSDSIVSLRWCLEALARRFQTVLFVPGNHDLWVYREAPGIDSLDRLDRLRTLAADHGVSTQAWITPELAIVPLLSWYDGSFGEYSPELRERWADFRACRWPEGMDDAAVCARLLALNPTAPPVARTVITFSHFVPRRDLLTRSEKWAFLDPVMGTTALDPCLRELGAHLHVFGHSHRQVTIERDGVTYINRAFGYPAEQTPDSARLHCIDPWLNA